MGSTSPLCPPLGRCVRAPVVGGAHAREEEEPEELEDESRRRRGVGRGVAVGRRRISPRCSASSRLTPAQADLVGKISELTKGPTRRTKGTYAGPAAARAEKPVKDEI